MPLADDATSMLLHLADSQKKVSAMADPALAGIRWRMSAFGP